jgi:hypothetical protein
MIVSFRDRETERIGMMRGPQDVEIIDYHA